MMMCQTTTTTTTTAAMFAQERNKIPCRYNRRQLDHDDLLAAAIDFNKMHHVDDLNNDDDDAILRGYYQQEDQRNTRMILVGTHTPTIGGPLKLLPPW
jgi:hypothetical protein